MSLDFGIRLRQVRKARGISQSVLAEMLGLTKQAISNYESGANTPTHGVFLRIADQMDVDLDFLAGRTDARCASVVDKMRKLSPDGRDEVDRFVDAVMEKEAKYGKKD